MKVIRLDGAIGDIGNTAEEFQTRIDDLQLTNEDDLQVIINSPGGSVFEGFAIYNKLKSLPNKINVKVEGMAASIATLIALAGEYIQMSEVGLWMIHRASTMAMGNSEELEKQIEVLDMIDNTLINVYSAKTGKPKEEIENLISKETFYDSEKALDEGWIDEVVDRIDQKMAANYEQLNKINMSKWSDFYTKFKANFVEDDSQEVAVEDPKVEEIQNETESDETTMTLETVMEEVTNLSGTVAELAKTVAEFIGAVVEKEEKVDQDVENLVSAQFQTLIAKLPKTNGKPATSASNGLNDDAPKWEPQHMAFKNQMKDIEKRTRK